MLKQSLKHLPKFSIIVLEIRLSIILEIQLKMTTEEKAKWFDLAMRFALDGKIHLVMKSRLNGVGNWTIVDTSNGKVLNSNMEWEEELPLNKRDEAFMIRVRFKFEDAVAMWEQYKMFAEEA